ncbi:hypothetical protein MCEMIH15_00673 [Caulobacteraceae bacterium]
MDLIIGISIWTFGLMVITLWAGYMSSQEP